MSGSLLQHFWFVLFLIAIAIFAKALLATAAPLALGYPLRTAVMTGLALAQVGEFSFIIAQSGFDYRHPAFRDLPDVPHRRPHDHGRYAVCHQRSASRLPGGSAAYQACPM